MHYGVCMHNNKLSQPESKISSGRLSGRAIPGGRLPGGRQPDVRKLPDGRQRDERRLVRQPHGPRATGAIGRQSTSVQRKPDGVRLPERQARLVRRARMVLRWRRQPNTGLMRSRKENILNKSLAIFLNSSCSET